MKVTVCELPNELAALETAWQQLVQHVQSNASEFVLLPEMPFYNWLAHSREVDPAHWDQAVQAHEEWMDRLHELAPATVAGTRPVILDGKRQNAGYVWEPGRGARNVHAKYYLPDEAGFWEASWYERGEGNFSLEDTARGKVGFLICTEIWFNHHAREYGKQGMQLLLCPRATPRPTAPKWVAGGQAAAVVSGAFCLSSNLSGTTAEGGDYAGVGWIIEPGEGKVLGLTSPEQPFLTIDIDLAEADRARETYPRYVLDFKPRPHVQSVAMRVSRMDAMLAFYSEAFGIRFRKVITGPFESQFGELDGLMLKFVPIRDGVDFDGYAVHQLGFSVPDVNLVISLAIQHGGRQEGEVVVKEGGSHAAIRDPDGNTIELYSKEE